MYIKLLMFLFKENMMSQWNLYTIQTSLKSMCYSIRVKEKDKKKKGEAFSRLCGKILRGEPKVLSL